MPNANRSNCTKQRTCFVATSIPQKVICEAHIRVQFSTFSWNHIPSHATPESSPAKPAGLFLPRPSVFLSTALDMIPPQSLAQINNDVTFSNVKPQDALDKLTTHESSECNRLFQFHIKMPGGDNLGPCS